MQDNDKVVLLYKHLADMVSRIEQTAPLYGEGAPTENTPAFHLGQTYLDTTTGNMYYCVAMPDVDESGESGLTIYGWAKIGGGEVPYYTNQELQELWEGES